MGKTKIISNGKLDITGNNSFTNVQFVVEVL